MEIIEAIAFCIFGIVICAAMFFVTIALPILISSGLVHVRIGRTVYRGASSQVFPTVEAAKKFISESGVN